MYPAFGSAEVQVAVADSKELFPERPSSGTHEVVVESPHHVDDFRRLPVAQVRHLLRALHARYCALASIPELAAIVVFKNKGSRAGTSLEHPHWQIITTRVMPPLLRRKLDVAETHFRTLEQCLYSELLRAEEQAQTRVIEATVDYVAFVPFASPMPYQVRIQPRSQKASWDELSVEELLPLATLLPSVLRRLDAELAEPDFNIIITCAPPHGQNLRSFSWHLDVVPRTTIDGGFELGAGMKINPVLPEQAALALRSHG
jgi:UDPglucose--hexose-1-phosphate uridylyltransferase